MRSKTPFIGLLLLSSILVSVTAGEPRVGKYARYDTGEYTIISSRGPKQAKQFVENLHKFRVTLEKLLGKRASNNQFPTTIVITGARDWSQYLQPRQNVAGFFHSVPFANYISMNGEWDPDEAVRIIFHEYTHYYLATQFAGEHPPWFNEGLAEFMAYVSFNRMPGTALVQIPMERVYGARDGTWIPFERMIRVDHLSPEYQSHKLSDTFYSQAWLTVHYGLIENREFGQQMFAYLNQRNMLRPHEEAVRNSFGTDLDAIDQKLRAYARNTRLGSGGVKLAEIPPVTLPTGEPITDTEAVAVLVDVMLQTQVAPDRIRPLVESLQRRDPESARTAILAARLAALEQNDLAFERAVTQAEAALAPGDWSTRRDLAYVLLQRATEYRPQSPRAGDDDKRDLERAYKWFGEAMTHNRADVKALWGFGTAALRLDQDLDLADDALVTAYKLAPVSAEIAASLANVNSRRNKPDAMIPYLQDTIRYSTNLSMRRWAADYLIKTREYLAERDAVEAQNKAQQAAYEKQLAEYEKKYGKKPKKK